MPAVRHVKTMGVTSLLDLTEQQWRQDAGPSSGGESALFLIDARDSLESLRDGTGWEIEYPRDVWRLHKLPGITIPAGLPMPLMPGCGLTASPSPGSASWPNDGHDCGWPPG